MTNLLASPSREKSRTPSLRDPFGWIVTCSRGRSAGYTISAVVPFKKAIGMTSF
jgi:hypothetical protein